MSAAIAVSMPVMNVVATDSPATLRTTAFCNPIANAAIDPSTMSAGVPSVTYPRSSQIVPTTMNTTNRDASVIRRPRRRA